MRRRRVADARPREGGDSGEAGARPDERVDGDLDPFDRDSAEPGCALVGPDRLDVPAQPRVTEPDGSPDREQEQDPEDQEVLPANGPAGGAEELERAGAQDVRAAERAGAGEAGLLGPLRAVAMAAGVACLWPFSLLVNVAGVAATAALLIYNVRFGPNAVEAAA